MRCFFRFIIGWFFFPVDCFAQTTAFPIITPTAKASIVYSRGTALDSICAHLLAADIERVTSVKPVVMTELSTVKGMAILIGAIQSPLIQQFIAAESSFSKKLVGQWECYGLTVINKPTPAIAKALLIAGSDARGTAYGVFSLSEKIGVSPWWWWADAQPAKTKTLSVTIPETISSPPAVKYRGIFINDEDWGLQPWAAKTFEPETGDIGPKTYAKVFELLLRLKTNLIWPAMHPSTKAFFHYPGNAKIAEDYGVVVGSSHAEPMLRNNVGEWDKTTMGPFNYFTNKEKIYRYWEDRIKEARNVNAIYSLGMRGVHDGQMEGIKDLKEAVPVLEKIIDDERQMLAKHINPNVTKVPQVLTPYKEVLEIYDHGLKVPDDVTLVWPDDNYGYIHRLNNQDEKARSGGAGVYYHASYWGRPHDYLWISSTHPSLIREEMMKAYETGADRLWVLNVGDIKPLEYNIQFFMDMAYNPAPFAKSSYAKKHLAQWAKNLFGAKAGTEAASLLWTYFNLAFERRPEFMGWSQTEPNTKTAYTAFNHFYFGDEAQQRIDCFDSLEAGVKRLRKQIGAKDADAFYQLVYYPLVGAAWMNKKFLYRDKAHYYAKQNRLSAHSYAEGSKAAYDSIVKETAYFNTALAGGKWNGMMSMSPRNLAVYAAPDLPAINIYSGEAWGLVPEGFVSTDSTRAANTGSYTLPPFDDVNKQEYFIDIFISKEEALTWKASPSGNWIRLSKTIGGLSPGAGKEQVRLQVSVDWNRLKEKTASGSISFIAGGKKKVVDVQAVRRRHLLPPGYTGFVENSGYVVMHAGHFSRKSNRSPLAWQRLSDLGYTGAVMQALPLSISHQPPANADSIQRLQSAVEYNFFTFSPATPELAIFAIPAHPVNNTMGARYAVSIDDGPLKTINIQTYGRSEEWKQNVLRNRSEKKIELPHLPAGKHTLKIYCLDPGVMLDEIRLDLGGLKKAYRVLPETRSGAFLEFETQLRQQIPQ